MCILENEKLNYALGLLHHPHLLHVVVELHLLFPQSSNEFLGRNSPNFSLLRHNTETKILN